MVKKEEIYRNDTVYPKRVLDLEATLASGKAFKFAVPTSWDFHVVSHTWTDAFRQLVKDCSELLAGIGWTRGSDPEGTTYMETIGAADFSGKSYHAAVFEFLRYLRDDGARRLWLDGVCINQYDAVEMASEMHYMGGFYGLSNACYVAPHGIGSPDGFKGLTAGNALPRWFSRVWTLQEYILPEKLYFLVEKYGDDVIEFISSDPESHDEDRAWIDWDSADDLSVNSLIPAGTYTGALGDFSRRKAASGTDLYFLGGMAYFEMMGTLLHAHVHGFKDASVQLFEDFYEAFGEIASGVDDIHMETLVKQIRVRYASSEEDRILGILGLIGFKGDYSLETGKTVDIQLVALAKLMHTQEHVSQLLINLCAAEYEGYEVAGISWAPDLFADPDTSRAQFRRYFSESYVLVKDYLAKVTGVEDDGALVMSAQTARGSLRKLADGEGGVKYALDVGHQSIKLLHDSEIAENLPIHAYYGDADHRGWQGGMMVAAPGIHNFKGYEPSREVPISDITLVLLGNSEVPTKKNSTCVLMVCIPLSRKPGAPERLHKIGAIHPHPSIASRARKLFHGPASELVVGGVGGDLSPYLAPECQTILKTFSSSTTASATTASSS